MAKKLKNWLFGKENQHDAKAQTTANLKKQINRLEIVSRNYQSKSDEQKDMAKKLLSGGNKKGASDALKRSKIYLQKYNKTQNTMLTIQTQLDTIEEVSTSVETVAAIKEGNKLVSAAMKEVSVLDAERAMAELEEQQEQASMMSEVISDTTSLEMDLDDDIDIDDELAALELEMQAESHGVLPEAGAKTATKPTEKSESELTDEEEELEKLKKELEGK
jgi:hypothetical protein